jgi:hypothetical protein
MVRQFSKVGLLDGPGSLVYGLHSRGVGSADESRNGVPFLQVVSAWVVAREDGSGPTLVCPPDQYEQARHELVRRALADNVDAVLLTVHVVQGRGVCAA